MTDIDRIIRHVLHDPWTARIFLAFTVGLFLSCSAEFAAGQARPRVGQPALPAEVVDPALSAPDVEGAT